MSAKRFVVGLVVLGAVSVSSSAFAQQGKPGAGAKDTAKSDAGYGYEFSDDPLAAGGLGANDATIKIRPGPVRATLILPRTSFVPEMLKSVENL